MRKATAAIGIVVLAGAAWLGTTWYVGKQAETVFANTISQANARIGQVLGAAPGRDAWGLHLESYERGFFSSEAVYTVRMKDAAGQVVDVRLRDHIQHGPFPVGALAAGQIAPVLAHINTGLVATPYTRAWIESQPDSQPVSARTTVTMSGDSVSAWELRPATFNTRDDMRIEFGGGTVQLDFRKQFTENDAAGLFQTLVASDPATGEKITLSDIRLNGNTRAGQNKTLISATEAQVASVLIDGGAAEPDDDIVLEQVSIKLDSTQDGKLLDTVQRYDAASVKAGGSDLGAMAVSGRLSRLDIPALVALGNEYDAILAAQGVTDPSKAVLSPTDRQKLYDKALEILVAKPTLTLEPVVWKNARGQSTGSLQLDFAPPDPGAAQAVQMVPPVVRKAHLKLGVSRPMVVELFGQLRQEGMDKAELERVGGMLFDQYVGRLQKAGLATSGEDSASADLLYEGNAMMVNGTAMPMQEFLMRAMMLLM